MRVDAVDAVDAGRSRAVRIGALCCRRVLSHTQF